MPKTRIISPGIPNHKLLKNLELNGKWLTNDANEDEGISISDAGIVTVKSTGNASETVLRLNDSQADGQYIDIQYHNGGDELRFKDQGDAYVDFLAGPIKATTYQGNFNQASGDGTHAVNFTTAVTENQGGNTAGKPRMRFSDDANAGATATQKFALGSGTSRFVEMVETYNPPSGSVAYEFLSLKPTIDQIVNGVASVDTLTPTPSGGAWQASQTHYDVAQTSTSGSGSGIKVRSITTNSDGNPTFVLETEFSDCGKNYAVDDTIVFTDPGSTSNTATLTVASVSNATGNYTAIKLNVTETSARGSANSLMDLQVGGSSKFKIDNSGNTTIGNIAEVGSDTDKFLMSDSGVVKYVTGANLLSYSGAQASLTFGIADTNAVKIDSGSVADDEYARFTSNGLESRSTSEVLSDIGAQATVTAGTNCTFSGATLNVDDAFVKNDTDDTMTGTLTIDKNVTSTDAGTYVGLDIDYDKTNASTSNNYIYGLRVTTTNTTATDGINAFASINNIATFTHAANAGVPIGYGLYNQITGHSNGSNNSNIGINNIVTGGDTSAAASQIGLYQKVDDGNYDLKFVSSADTGDFFSLAVGANGATTIATLDDDNNEAAHLTFDIQGDTIFKGDIADGTSTEVARIDSSAASLLIASGKKIEFADTGEYITSDATDLTIASGGDILLDSTTDLVLDAANGVFKFYDDGDTADSFKITVIGGTGNTTLETVSAAADGFLTLKPDASAVIIDSADLQLYPTQKLYFDSGGDTYINESAADTLSFTVGNDAMMVLYEDGATNGNYADFGTTGVGFTQFEPTFNATDTYVYFNRNGNKAFLTVTANMTDLHLHFPNVSCNCVLLVKQDSTGSRTIQYYKTFDQAGGNESTVVWSGGSNPTLTTTGNKLDILSFYWDNDNHKAYGVASLNF